MAGCGWGIGWGRCRSLSGAILRTSRYAMPVALSSAMVRHAIPGRRFASTPSVIARNVGIAEEISAERMERFFVKVEEG
jgi:hypothetical protein